MTSYLHFDDVEDAVSPQWSRSVLKTIAFLYNGMRHRNFMTFDTIACIILFSYDHI
jgi:hypothetical protein